MAWMLAHSGEPVPVDTSPSIDDVIEISELRLRCIIGINGEERRDRQEVMISLRVGTEARLAATRDCLNSVWNYRTATKAIIAHVESSSYFTVEKLATEIARIVIVDHDAPWAQVRVHKRGALRFASTVGLVIYRCADDFRRTEEAARVTEPSSSLGGDR